MRLRWALGLGLSAGFGCALLTPYPGDGNPADILAGSAGADGNSPFDRGDPQDPLIDPAIDSTITILSNVDPIVANEGQAFTVDLQFSAENRNVVGGGIQFAGSEEIQWTFLEQLRGQQAGQIQFGYVVERGTCGRVPNLCHKIETQQFAVAENPTGADVDGDGTADGDFVVSPPVDVDVILRCATCDSPSCRELLVDTPDACSSCSQPARCNEIFELCFADGAPLFMTDEAEDFDRVFGPEGLAWKTAGVCAGGEELCESAFQGLIDECTPMDTDTDTDGMTGG